MVIATLSSVTVTAAGAVGICPGSWTVIVCGPCVMPVIANNPSGRVIAVCDCSVGVNTVTVSPGCYQLGILLPADGDHNGQW
jgi:hypothetical protein